MLNLNTIMIGSAQPKILATFYEKVFEKPADMTEDSWFGWSVGSCYFTIGGHSEVSGNSKEPARIIFNFETNEVKSEFERIKKLGATVIKEPYEMEEGKGSWLATFADLDGNYFQLTAPWN